MNKHFGQGLVAILYFLAKPIMILALVGFCIGFVGTHLGWF
jgi:hypothetical protein